ncbi:ABC transporter permease subunit [Ancylobacter sp. TS-1]|uniref:ABC transporter permease subunit n=1 Tax=Ancylobacter sp. TS-1 TaxID=1850374 RepID=UPI001265D0D2|nr:ABC transporter permease subunit [Ancylobacter sp. TS-1]QFR31782.1 ABC transporter permease subunit [Ancylobacter sp. TS-1]
MAEENAIDDPIPTAPERLVPGAAGASLSAIAAAEPVGEEPSSLRAFWSAFSENRGAVLGLAIVVFIALLALFAPWVAPHSPTEQFRQSVLLPPVWAGGNWSFPFGTDAVGRDVLSRLIYGARISLGIGLSVMVVSVALGIVLGLASAFLRGIVEVVVMRIMDVVVAIPSLVLAILVVAVLGPSLVNTIVAVTVVYLPRYVRLVRAAAIAELSKEYVIAAQVAGVGRLRLMFVTVLPNCLAPLIVQAALGISDAILEAAALGFLGLGAQPPTPEWGAMLADAREFIRSAPWIVTLPGLAILVTVVAINLMGDGLRDALDPKLRRS